MIARGGQNVYGSWGSANVKHGSDFAHIAGGQNAAGGNVHWRTSDGNHGFVAGGKGGDIYAGRDGNVYRRDNGQWQQHTPDGWNPVQKPSTDNLKQHGENFAARHPDAAQQIGQGAVNPVQRNTNRIRPVTPENLGLDRAGRQIGNQRAFQQEMIRRPSMGEFDGGDFQRGGGFGGGGFGGGGFNSGGGFHGGGGFHSGGGFRGR